MAGEGGAFLLIKPEETEQHEETTGGIDLLAHFGLKEHLQLYQSSNPPSLITDSRFLRKSDPDVGIRKGEGMELAPVAVSSNPKCNTCTGVLFRLVTLFAAASNSILSG